MGYILETISTERQEKIIQDFKCDPEIFGYLKYLAKERMFPENWAIDRELNTYLLMKPITVRTETAECPYLFYFDEKCYCVVNGNMFSNEFYFEKKYEPSINDLPCVLQKIKQAFSIYGRTGVGELNEFGIPEFRIIPDFSERA